MQLTEMEEEKDREMTDLKNERRKLLHKTQRVREPRNICIAKLFPMIIYLESYSFSLHPLMYN